MASSGGTIPWNTSFSGAADGIVCLQESEEHNGALIILQLNHRLCKTSNSSTEFHTMATKDAVKSIFGRQSNGKDPNRTVPGPFHDGGAIMRYLKVPKKGP